MKYDSVNGIIYYKRFICFNHLEKKHENFQNNCIYMATQIDHSKVKLAVYDLDEHKLKNELIFNWEKILKTKKKKIMITIHFILKKKDCF